MVRERTHVAKERGRIVVEPREQEPAPGMKPKGLWFEVDGDWRRWCRGEMPHWVEGRPLHRVTFGSERILRITRGMALDSFDQLYRATEHRAGYSEKYGPMHLGIRWADVAKEWDGIEIAPYLWSHRFSGPTWYYGWDCASGVIWRPRGVRLDPIGTVPPGVDGEPTDG